MIRRTFSIVALFFLSSSIASADVIVDWDFSVLDYPNSGLVTNDPAPNPILTSSQANAIAGLSVSDMTPSGLAVVVNANTMAGEADLRDFDFPAGTGDGVNDNYFEFTMTADVGGSLNVDSISISEWRNGGGAVDGMAFDFSVNGGAFGLYDAVQVDANSGDFGFDTFTFSQAILGADSVAFRFTPRQVNQGSSGNIHINGVTVNGSVVPVPEPGSIAVLAVVGLVGLTRRRRK